MNYYSQICPIQVFKNLNSLFSDDIVPVIGIGNNQNRDDDILLDKMKGKIIISITKKRTSFI